MFGYLTRNSTRKWRDHLFSPNNHNSLYLLHYLCSDIKIITVSSRPDMARWWRKLRSYLGSFFILCYHWMMCKMSPNHFSFILSSCPMIVAVRAFCSLIGLGKRSWINRSLSRFYGSSHKSKYMGWSEFISLERRRWHWSWILILNSWSVPL